MNNSPDDFFVSVDVETSGPIPGIFSLLSIGACVIADDSIGFECLLKPISDTVDAQAMAVNGLSLSLLSLDGLEPETAMSAFAKWLERFSGGRTPVFVGLNAGFDWSFVNYYFHKFTGGNPFGFAPLDIKALYMGATGASWRESKSSAMSKFLGAELIGDHTALRDSKAQAEIFRLTMEYRARNMR